MGNQIAAAPSATCRDDDDGRPPPCHRRRARGTAAAADLALDAWRVVAAFADAASLVRLALSCSTSYQALRAWRGWPRVVRVGAAAACHTMAPPAPDDDDVPGGLVDLVVCVEDPPRTSLVALPSRERAVHGALRSVLNTWAAASTRVRSLTLCWDRDDWGYRPTRRSERRSDEPRWDRWLLRQTLPAWFRPVRGDPATDDVTLRLGRRSWGNAEPSGSWETLTNTLRPHVRRFEARLAVPPWRALSLLPVVSYALGAWPPSALRTSVLCLGLEDGTAHHRHPIEAACDLTRMLCSVYHWCVRPTNLPPHGTLRDATVRLAALTVTGLAHLLGAAAAAAGASLRRLRVESGTLVVVDAAWLDHLAWVGGVCPDTPFFAVLQRLEVTVQAGERPSPTVRSQLEGLVRRMVPPCASVMLSL